MKIKPKNISLNYIYEKIQLNYIYAWIRGFVDGLRKYPNKEIPRSDYENFVTGWGKRQSTLISLFFSNLEIQLEAEKNYLLVEINRLNTATFDAISEQVIAGRNYLSEREKEVIDEEIKAFPSSQITIEHAHKINKKLKKEVDRHWKDVPFRTKFEKFLYWSFLVFVGVIEAPINYYALISSGEASIFAIVVVLVICVFLPASGHSVGKALKEVKNNKDRIDKVLPLVMPTIILLCVSTIIIIMAFLRSVGFKLGNEQQVLTAISNDDLMRILFLVIQFGLLTMTIYISSKYYEGYNSEKASELRKASERYTQASNDYETLQKIVGKLNGANKVIQTKLASLNKDESSAREQILNQTDSLQTKYRDTNKRWNKNYPEGWN